MIIMEGGSPENFAIAFLWVLCVHVYHLSAIVSRNAVTNTFIYQAIGAGIPMFSCLIFLEMFWVSKFKFRDHVVTAASFTVFANVLGAKLLSVMVNLIAIFLLIKAWIMPF